jgi:hypothetical protein
MADLVHRLRGIRSAYSSEKNLPAYCIFDNKTLIGIAVARPRTAEELLTVPGIGPTKLAQYGPAVLAVTGNLSAAAARTSVEAALRADEARKEQILDQGRKRFRDDQQPSRQGARWTPEEDADLIKRFKRGETVFAIARAFNRTALGIHMRLQKAGLVAKDSPWPGYTEAVPVATQPAKGSFSNAASSRDGAVCVICFDAPRNQFFQPCGHVSCCKACSASLTLCPLCRRPITSKLNAFL